MNISKLFFIIVILFACPKILTSQDIHFSQFENAPLNLNPALTGFYSGNHRVLLNYRDQWSDILRGDAYTTAVISYDAKIKLGNQAFIGLGINGTADSAGELDFGTEQSKYLASYIRQIGKDSSSCNFISFGLDLGIVKRKVDLNNLRWPSQHDGNGGFDAIDEGGNPIFFDSDFVHADIGIGALWQSIYSERGSFSFGVALHHINRPNVSFLEEERTLTIRKTIHANAEFGIGLKTSLLPSVLYMSQGPHNQILLGSSFRWYMNKEQKLSSAQVGVHSRIGNKVDGGLDPNAFIFSAEINFRKVMLGFSYDYTISELQNVAVSAKALELSIGYIFNKDKFGESCFGNVY